MDDVYLPVTISHVEISAPGLKAIRSFQSRLARPGDEPLTTYLQCPGCGDDIPVTISPAWRIQSDRKRYGLRALLFGSIAAALIIVSVVAVVGGFVESALVPTAIFLMASAAMIPAFNYEARWRFEDGLRSDGGEKHAIGWREPDHQ